MDIIDFGVLIDARSPYWQAHKQVFRKLFYIDVGTWGKKYGTAVELTRGVLIDVRGHLEARAPYWRAASWQAWADQGRKHVFENYGKDNIKSC